MGDIMIIRALCDIPADTELFINYNNPDPTSLNLPGFNRRRQYLLDGRHFECECALCRYESEHVKPKGFDKQIEALSKELLEISQRCMKRSKPFRRKGGTPKPDIAYFNDFKSAGAVCEKLVAIFKQLPTPPGDVKFMHLARAMFIVLKTGIDSSILGPRDDTKPKPDIDELFRIGHGLLKELGWDCFLSPAVGANGKPASAKNPPVGLTVRKKGLCNVFAVENMVHLSASFERLARHLPAGDAKQLNSKKISEQYRVLSKECWTAMMGWDGGWEEYCGFTKTVYDFMVNGWPEMMKEGRLGLFREDSGNVGWGVGEGYTCLIVHRM